MIVSSKMLWEIMLGYLFGAGVYSKNLVGTSGIEPPTTTMSR